MLIWIFLNDGLVVGDLTWSTIALKIDSHDSNFYPIIYRTPPVDLDSVGSHV